MDVSSALTKQVVGTMYDDLVKYYGLYGFIKYKAKSLFEKPIVIDSVSHFWSMVLQHRFIHENDSQKLLNGQLLNFTSRFYLSEWAPKIPGRIWTKEGQLAFDDAFKHQITDQHWDWKKRYEVIFDETGKKKAMEAGFGSVRINPSKNPIEAFMYMSLSTPEDWDIDSAIPVVVSKSVFEEYRKKSVANGAVEIGKLEGILVLDVDLPLTQVITNAIGAEIDKKSIDILTKRPFLPKCFVYIPSVLGVDFKYNNSHPECTGWTMYKKKTPYDGQKNYNQKLDYEYGFTYNCFDPTKPESIVEAVEFMKDYAQYNSGTEIITDFDGMEPKFDSKLSLQSDPSETQKMLVKDTVEDLNRFVESIDM